MFKFEMLCFSQSKSIQIQLSSYYCFLANKFAFLKTQLSYLHPFHAPQLLCGAPVVSASATTSQIFLPLVKVSTPRFTSRTSVTQLS